MEWSRIVLWHRHFSSDFPLPLAQMEESRCRDKPPFGGDTDEHLKVKNVSHYLCVTTLRSGIFTFFSTHVCYYPTLTQSLVSAFIILFQHWPACSMGLWTGVSRALRNTCRVSVYTATQPHDFIVLELENPLLVRLKQRNYVEIQKSTVNGTGSIHGTKPAILRHLSYMFSWRNWKN